VKALIFVGARNHEGHTGRATKALVEGFRQGGVEPEEIWLLERDVRMCTQRGMDGFGNCLAEGVCKIGDDFEGLVQKIRDSDMVVFVTPVYWGDLSEIIRAFLDRLRRICLHENGKKGIAGKLAAGVCVASGGGGGAPNSANSLQRVLGHCDFDVLDVVPARRQNLDLKLDVLKLTGKWLAERPLDAKKA
jgi:multimeric flavodoxin WrbA